MKIISIMVLPIFVLIIICYGYFKKIDIYNSFLKGAKEGLEIVLNITPAILAMVFAVNIFLDSDILSFLLYPIHEIVLIPNEVASMAFLRPISGTASMSIMTTIFQQYGPDSFYGRLTSVLQGCTDTTIYVIALYYGSIKVSKTRYTIFVGLMADLVGIIMAFILTNIFF